MGSRARAYNGSCFNNGQAEASNKASYLLAQDLIKRGLREQAILKLQECLSASRSYWDGVQKMVVQEPDYKVIRQTAMDVLGYTDGKIPERHEIMQILANFGVSQEERTRLTEVIADKLADGVRASVLAQVLSNLKTEDLKITTVSMPKIQTVTQPDASSQPDAR